MTYSLNESDHPCKERPDKVATTWFKQNERYEEIKNLRQICLTKSVPLSMNGTAAVATSKTPSLFNKDTSTKQPFCLSSYLSDHSPYV